MACGNLDIANDFNLFLFGDHTQSSVDSEGRVAVGGNATYTDYGIGSALPPDPNRDDLIIQGNVNITRGENMSGNTVVYPTSTVINYTMSNPNGQPNEPLIGTPIDFAQAQATLTELSMSLSALAPNGTVSNNFEQLVLTGTDPALNVFLFNGNNADGSGLRLDTANGIDIIAPVGSTILINVGDDNIGFGSYQIFRNGITATPQDGQTILWNFFQATSAFNQNLSITGSVLAPYADWSALGFGNINGTLVANSLTNVTGSLEAHHIPFTGCLPIQPIVPTTTTTTTFAPLTTTTTTTTASTTSTTTGVPTTSTTTALPTTTTTTTTQPLIPTPNIVATKTANVTAANLGDIIRYTVTITNTGSGIGDSVLNEMLPEGIIFIPGSLMLNNVLFSGRDITEGILIGAINPGQTITLQFEVIVAAFPPNGQIVNRGGVVTVNPGTIPTTCSPFEQAIVSANNAMPVPGRKLPAALAFIPGITPLPGAATRAGSVTVPGVSLPPILGVTLPFIQGRVSPIVSTHNISVPLIQQVAAPNLIVFHRFFGKQFFVGQRLTYSVFVINNGNTVAGRTRLVGIVPQGAQFIEGTVRVNRKLLIGADPNAGFSLGPIAPNEGLVVRFDVLITSARPLTHFSSVTADFVLPSGAVDTRTFSTDTVTNTVLPVSIEGQAVLTKSASVQSAQVGDTFRYTILFENRSDALAENVIITDNLDAALQFLSGSLAIDGVPQQDPKVGIAIGTIGPGTARTVSFDVRVQFSPMNNIIHNVASAFFDFRFRGICFRGGIISNQATVVVEEEEE